MKKSIKSLCAITALCILPAALAFAAKQTQGTLVVNPGLATSCSAKYYSVKQKFGRVVQDKNVCYNLVPCDAFQQGGFQVNYVSNSTACPGNIDKVVVDLELANGAQSEWTFDTSASALSADSINSDDVAVCNGHFTAGPEGSPLIFATQSSSDSRGNTCVITHT